MELKSPPQFFEKYSNIEFHQNRFSESRVFPWRRTDGWTHSNTDKRADMTKVIFVFAILPTRLIKRTRQIHLIYERV